MQIASSAPTDREVAVQALQSARDVIERADGDDDARQTAIRIASMAPVDKEDALRVLDLALELLDLTTKSATHPRLHSLRRVWGFKHAD